MDPATRPRLVSTVHGLHSVNRYSAVMTRGERVIAVSESTRRYVLENYPKTPDECIRVIPRGIDPAEYGCKRRPNVDWLKAWESAYPGFSGKCLLLLPGRITRLKGHEDFFRLVGALKQAGIPVHGLVAGDAHPKKQSYVQELRGKLAELGLESDLTFLAHRADIREVMGVVNLVCALSQQPESFGRTVLEALALGKPVVGYDCGGVGELLGRLFPAGRVPLGDHSRLVDATTAILRDHPLPLAVGEPFTLEAMCQSTLGVYQELSRPRDLA